MRCTACGTELIAGKKFCHVCGTRVNLTCATCGAALQPEFRFCPDCGADTSSVAPSATQPTAINDGLARLARHIPEGLAAKIRAVGGSVQGERKLVTVLFCDLADSTALGERLDPEDFRDLLDRYLELATEAVYRFEGIVSSLAGDGLMAIFGAPLAHEDDPRRAVHAALAIREALDRFNREQVETRGVTLTARIGVHTGPVVLGAVGSDLKMDYTAIGDTTNLASRLQSVARPGGIVVSEATYRLVRGFFELRSTGTHVVKGKSEPVEAYEVLDIAKASSAIEVAAARGLTPLVGRDDELAQLDACYRGMQQNFAQVVAIVGDAGLGKSRLLFEFKRRLAADEIAWFETRCASLNRGVPYFPFVAALRRYFRIATHDAPAIMQEKIAQKVRPWDPELTFAYPSLLRFLSVPANGAHDLPADELKRASFEAMAHMAMAVSLRRPVIMVVEDLHYIDDASRELLETMVARLPRARIMGITTYRPDYVPSWRPQATFTQLTLHPLAHGEATTLLHRAAGGQLPAELEEPILTKAEGSPFFIEEITRALFDEGYLVREQDGVRLTRPVGEMTIPGTVQEVVAARLDRLSPSAKHVAQVAAALGRQFSRTQLRQLLDSEEISVEQELAELERRGLIHNRNVLDSDELRFGESITQEVAYEGLLFKQRRQLHERIGALIEGTPGDAGAGRFALLAHHYGRSDNHLKALAATVHAAEEAERVPSYAAAAELFRQAWELVEAGVGDESSNEVQRLLLEAANGLARVTVIFGIPSQHAAERAAARGRVLAEALGDNETLSALYFYQGMLGMHGSQEEVNAALELAERGLTLAEQLGLTTQALRIARSLSVPYIFDGRFDLARRAINWAVGELERTGHRERTSDLYLGTRWVRDTVLYLGDDLDAAQTNAQETYELAVRGSNRTCQTGVAGTLAQIHFLRGEYAEALRWADLALEIAEAISLDTQIPAPAAIALAARVELGQQASSNRYLELIDRAERVSGGMQVNVRFVSDALLAVDDLSRINRFAEHLRALRPVGRLRQGFTEIALGQLATRLGQIEEAERAYRNGLRLCEAVGARSSVTAAALGAAELAAARGRRCAGTPSWPLPKSGGGAAT